MKVISALIVSLFSTLAFSQDSLKNKLVLSFNLGIQAHDKRLFDFPPRRTLLELQPELIGTYQFNIILNKIVELNDNLDFFYGFGLGSELSTFLRPFNHKYGVGTGYDQLRYTNRFYKFLFDVPICFRLNNARRIKLTLEMLPQFDILTIADTKENVYYENYSWAGFNFYSLEINPGLSTSFKKYSVGLKYRMFQIKRIDRIIFNHVINDHRTSKLETFNPIKIWLSISRNLN